MNKNESIMVLLVGLNEVFPEFSFTKNSLSLYVDALCEIDFEKFKMALQKCVSSCRCFPKPVEIIEFANNL